MHKQYLRCPVGSGQDLYLVAHQALFVVKDGTQYRLCDFKSEIRDLKISEDGSLLSFFTREESNGDIYVYSIASGQLKRITYFDDPRLANVSLTTTKAVVSTNIDSGHLRRSVYEIDLNTLRSQLLPYADAAAMTEHNGQVIVQRFGYGYHMWRGYQGGTAARLWVYEPNKAPFELPFEYNNAYSPLFVDGRLFFVSDFVDNCPNLYEYFMDSDTWEQRTFYKDHCVREISAVDDSAILYSKGGDIYRYSLATDKSELLQINGIDYSCTERPYATSNVIDYVTGMAVNDKGNHIAVAARGHVFSTKLWDKSFVQHTSDIRYRHTVFLSDTKLLYIKDGGDNSIFIIHDVVENVHVKTLEFAVGAVSTIEKIDEDSVILQNHKGTLFIVNFSTDELTQVVRGKFNHLEGYEVSPDKKWVAYSAIDDANSKTGNTSNSIYLYKIQDAQSYKVTQGYNDRSPTFSKDGKYLFFLSDMELATAYDPFYFNLYFKNNTAICGLCLNKSVGHPFKPWTLEEKSKDNENDDKEESQVETKKSEDSKDTKDSNVPAVEYPEIVINEIRCVKSGFPNGKYDWICSISDSKLLVLNTEEESKGWAMHVAKFETNNISHVMSQVDDIALSSNREWMLVLSGDKLRIGPVGESFNEGDKSYKEGGLINLHNIDLIIDPKAEWQNTLFECWWLIKEYFWNRDLRAMGWDQVLEKYTNLLPKVRSREDLNLVLEELIGENGTSHNFIPNRGETDVLQHPGQGYLAAKFAWKNGYEVLEIDDISDFEGFRNTPLTEPGVSIQIGDVITEIDGIRCEKDLPIEHYLRYKANKKVILTYLRDEKKYSTTVVPIRNIGYLNHRKWVANNRKYVHKQSENKIGYIHIPNMGPYGFTEFHKWYNQERNREGIIIDVRNNGGGHVSSLLIKTLLSIQRGFDVSQDQFHPYPEYSNKGKFVLLCDEYCGSDGDIFTYMFRKYNLGEIVGRRTWGGVVGITGKSRFTFIDGGYTTQPSFAYIQYDLKVKIENYGVEPDFDIPNPPEHMTDWPENDPQLGKALDIIMKKIDHVDKEEEMRQALYGQ